MVLPLYGLPPDPDPSPDRTLDIQLMFASSPADDMFDQWLTGMWGNSLTEPSSHTESQLVERPWAFNCDHAVVSYPGGFLQDIGNSTGSGSGSPQNRKGSTGSRGGDDARLVSETDGNQLLAVEVRNRLISRRSKKGEQQRRFRARQKANLTQLEREVQMKLSQVQLLTEENEKLRQKTDVLEIIISNREEHLGLLAEHGCLPLCDGRVHECSKHKHCMVSLATLPSICPEVAREITCEELKDAWKQAVFKFSSHLLAVEKPNPDPEVVATLSELITNATNNFKTISMLNPCVVLKVKALNMDTGVVEAPPDEFWARVAYMVQSSLTEHMRYQLQQCLDKYQEGVRKLHLERQSLMKEIEAEQESAVGVCILQSINSGSIGPLLEKLQQNMRCEQAYVDMLSSFCLYLFPPIVKARIWFHSYPYFPDIVKVVALLTSEVGLPDPLNAQGQGS